MTFLRRRRAEDELVEEIETHLSLLADHYRHSGMSDAEARHAAQRALGGAIKTRQLYREAGRWRWLDAFVQDARHSARLLIKNRGFALVATLVLALGIGVNHMMFTIIYAHTLRGLPIPQADRVLMGSFVDNRGVDTALSWPEFEDVRSQARAFASVAAIGATVPVALGDLNRAPDRYNATYVTANAFQTLGIALMLGRSFTSDEERSPGSSVAILGTRAWRARYGEDPGILGREILVNGQPTTVVGVLPERSGFPSTAEVWLPLLTAPTVSRVDRHSRALRVFGRVADGERVDSARAELETLLLSTASRTDSGSRLLASVTPISARFFGRPTDPAWIAFITAGFLVLVVSCANVANLMLARGTHRAREMAIRGALGATRARMFMQTLTESTVIALGGGIVGLGLSLTFVRVFRSFVPAGALSYWLHYTMDTTVFLALVAVAFGTVFIFGLLPSIQASKTDVIQVLRDGGWSGTTRTAARRWTTTFMTVQIALAVVLLAPAVTNWLDQTEPSDADRAVSAPDILTASISLAGERYRSPTQRAAFFRALTDRLRAVPGVASVSLTSTLPRQAAAEQRLQFAPAVSTRLEELPRVWTLSIAPNYFATLRVPVLQGREFSAQDAEHTERVAVVNRRFVAMFLQDEIAVGRRITVINPTARETQTATIVGVAEDTTHRDERDPVVYLPLAVTAPTTVFTLVRSHIDSAVMTAQLRETVLALDGNLPVYRAMTLERAVYEAEWNPRISTLLISTLILIVLTLSAVGLYATTAQAVYQRTKEFGIRIATGARPHQLRLLVVRRAALPVVLGLTVGVLGAIGWNAIFSTGRVDVRFVTPAVLVPIAVVLLAIMTCALIVPIRHAVRVDPVTALRQD